MFVSFSTDMPKVSTTRVTLCLWNYLTLGGVMMGWPWLYGTDVFRRRQCLWQEESSPEAKPDNLTLAIYPPQLWRTYYAIFFPIMHPELTNPIYSTSSLISCVQTKLKQSKNLVLNYWPIESTPNLFPHSTKDYYHSTLLHCANTCYSLNMSAPNLTPETQQWMWWSQERQTLWGNKTQMNLLRWCIGIKVVEEPQAAFV